PGFAYVGGGGSPRQGGWSFRLRPRRPVFTMRGVVTFQWRHGTSVIATGYRTTTAGRESLGGVADPAHFSAATCLVG
ncbi:MAG TPA: hypothetical protein VKG62_08700, partial [Solirubrobacteraceae bacterium]|nr:hypothetical protein [Solirubrobacteraceae bacterium]